MILTRLSIAWVVLVGALVFAAVANGWTWTP
jgi:hypothetical protein